MGGGGSKAKSSGTTQPVFYETWFPGQKEYMGSYLDPMKEIYAGNYASPQAKMMQQIAGEAAQKETATTRRQIAGTRGLSTPQKAKLISQMGGGAVSAMAGIPQSIWQVAAQVLGQYALTPPQVSTGQLGQEKSESKAFEAKICWVWSYFNGKNGEDTNLVRAYRDSHFGRYSDVAQGYREMGKVMKPLLDESSLVRMMVYYLIYKPITAIARGSHNPFYLGLKYLWKFIFQEIGARARAHLSKRGVPLDR
jgi:hypothetical protein